MCSSTPPVQTFHLPNKLPAIDLISIHVLAQLSNNERGITVSCRISFTQTVEVILLGLVLAGCVRPTLTVQSRSAATTAVTQVSPIAESSEAQQPSTLSLSNAHQITETARLQGHLNGVNAISFNSDGTLLASGDAGSSIRLWDVKQRKELTEFEGPTGHVADMVFHPNGETIIAITTNWGNEEGFHKMRLWNVKTHEEVSTFAQIGLTAAEDVRPASALAISPDGKLLAMNTCSGSVSMSNGGQLLCDVNGVRLFDVDTGDPVGELPQTFDATVREMAFSPDGTQLAAVGRDGTAHIFNVKNATEEILLRADEYSALAVDFSQDGKHIAVALGDGTIHLFDAVTGKELQSLQGPTEAAVSVAFNPDGTLLASAGIDNTIRVWNVATGEAVAVLPGHSDYVISVAFSPDGSLIASGSYDNTVRLWGLAD